MIEAPHNGPKGQGNKRSYGSLKIKGLYPSKAAAERAATAYVQNVRVRYCGSTEADAIGTGYPAVTK